MANKTRTKEFLQLVQKRVARVSIAPSTLRGQGSGVMVAAQKFLMNLSLAELKNINSKEFSCWLDQNTLALERAFPPDARLNWGAARKSINIFLESCLLNCFLSEDYDLDRLAEFMETPLDNPAAKMIHKKAESLGMPIRKKWKTIRSLEPDQSASLQEVALKWANEKKVPRGYLDLWLWQGDSDD